MTLGIMHSCDESDDSTNYQCRSRSYIDITIVLLQKTMKKTLFMYADIIFINEK